jgi:hypothetical protein
MATANQDVMKEVVQMGSWARSLLGRDGGVAVEALPFLVSVEGIAASGHRLAAQRLERNDQWLNSRFIIDLEGLARHS